MSGFLQSYDHYVMLKNEVAMRMKMIATSTTLTDRNWRWDLVFTNNR